MGAGRLRPGRAALIVKVGAAALALVFALALAFRGRIERALGGAFTGKPSDLAALPEGARRLVQEAYRGIDPRQLADHHVHLAGIGTGASGAFVHPGMQSALDPRRRARFLLYMSAAGVSEDAPDPDRRYVERLVELARNLPAPGRLHLLAFDKHYEPDGTVNLDRTELYVPDDYVLAVAAAHPDLFAPVISVHPYRADALEALERGAARGARWVKWLPNAMGIDPAAPRCDAYYEKMRELGLVLLAHAGDEMAVEAEEDQALGNPLRLRRALDRGVKVVVAHAASLGDGADLDSDRPGARASNFRLFLRLMDEPRYRGLVFGEISAIAQVNRLGEPLDVLLEREDLHPRLLNGSDYPLPAVNALVHTRALAARGYITAEEREHLNALYDVNPLLFDFVLKRTVRHPMSGKRFAPEVFMAMAGRP